MIIFLKIWGQYNNAISDLLSFSEICDCHPHWCSAVLRFPYRFYTKEYFVPIFHNLLKRPPFQNRPLCELVDFPMGHHVLLSQPNLFEAQTITMEKFSPGCYGSSPHSFPTLFCCCSHVCQYVVWYCNFTQKKQTLRSQKKRRTFS